MPPATQTDQMDYSNVTDTARSHPPGKPHDRRSKPRPNRDYPRGVIPSAQSYFRNLGPGLITGAADDDPSGIATYSQAGAAYGFGFLWMAFLSLPLMAAVQLMCARVGILARSGLGAVLRQHYPPWVVWIACVLLLISNIINIAADLSGMAAATSLLTGISPVWFVPVFAVIILVLLLYASYEMMTRVLKWLALVLFAYVIAAFLARPNWEAVLIGTLVPSIPLRRDTILMIVALLGTTISPYLFFWQAAQNAEQEEHREQTLYGRRRRSIYRELRLARNDVGGGMFVSTAIMYFIILTAGATLYPAGEHEIQTAAQAASALEPIAGPGASFLFTIGLVGTGMLAIPVLAGSAAYAVAEAAAWRSGMDETPRQARHFYGVIVVAMVAGMGLAFIEASAMKMLVWAAVINGLLAPPMIIIILFVSNNEAIMGEHRNSRMLNLFGGLAALLMTAAAVALIVSWIL